MRKLDLNLANCIEWSLSQPQIKEVVNYFLPIKAVPPEGSETNLNTQQKLEQQYRIGEGLPLTTLEVNIIGLIMIGRAKDVALAWEAFKEFNGPKHCTFWYMPGVEAWLSGLLNIPNGYANFLLEIHSGPLNLKKYSATIIAEHLRQGTVRMLDS